MVSTRQQRDAVSWAEATYQLSQRRACRALGVRRNLVQYVS
jgi:hypothetical protein